MPNNKPGMHKWDPDSTGRSGRSCQCGLTRSFEGHPSGKRPGMYVYEYFRDGRSIGWSPDACPRKRRPRRPGAPSPPAVPGGMTTKLTVHDACEGKVILLTDPDMNLVFAWNGSATFTVYQEAGLEYREVDGWTTDVRPTSLEEAKGRCRSRLELIRREQEEAEREPSPRPLPRTGRPRA